MARGNENYNIFITSHMSYRKAKICLFFPRKRKQKKERRVNKTLTEHFGVKSNKFNFFHLQGKKNIILTPSGKYSHMWSSQKSILLAEKETGLTI